ncbi:crossover junction endonuclease EME1 [Heliangelus exortis]|uniref:crossover junction endonuclease EME1 n=1 Tax=Heliangelus exortis TaxID=472823 RepID=UPI003A8E81A8
MAERDPRGEGSQGEEEDEEEKEVVLPTLASLLQRSPTSPPPEPRRLGPQPGSPRATEREVIVVASSGSEEEEDEEKDEEEDEEVEVVPLIERIRKAVAFEPSQLGGGDAAGVAGEGPCGSRNNSCGVRPPQPDPPHQPDGLRVKKASSGTASLPEELKSSCKKRKAVSQDVQQRRKEQEKEQRRALARRRKALRPGECQKYMRVALDPVLLQVEGGGQILSALQAANYSCVVESQAVPCSISWRRKTVSSQMEESDEWTEEPNVLALLPLEEFLSMVHNYKQEAQHCTGQKETLQSYVAQAVEKIPGKILALAVVGVESYIRGQPKKRLQPAAASGNTEEEQGKQRKKKAKGSGLEITRKDVDEVLVDLYLSTQVQVRLLESQEELGEFATMFSKAVAEAPFKREQENTGFSFYFEKRWCGGVRVQPSGKGLLEVWKRQIQQFNRVSPEMAEAIVSAYPSPQLLIQAYNRCSSEQERDYLLANITVHRGEGVTATSRRIGPDLSRRIHLQMTSHDPDLCLDATG